MRDLEAAPPDFEVLRAAEDAHGGRGMPAVQPRTGCDPPGGHGKMGGVGGTGCKQNLEGLARKFAALAPKWRRQKGGQA